MSISPNLGTIKVPIVSADLIQYLDQVFPDRLDPAWDMLAFRERIGARSVVDHLRSIYTEQETTPNVHEKQHARTG